MDFMKNTALALCLFFLIGCIKFGVSKNELAAFDISKISFDQETYPVVIIGGGVSGLTSANYLSRANIKNIVIEGPTPGGAITFAHSIRNWPGELDISGKKLSKKLRNQVKENNVETVSEEVIKVDFSIWPYKITTKNIENQSIKTLKALCCIIAMGVKVNYLDIPGERGEEGYWGKGIADCAVCEGTRYKDKIVAVVGGGNTAISEVSYLSNLAKKVFLIVRSEELRAKGKEIEDVKNKPNVEILYNTMAKEIKGNKKKITDLVIYNSKEKEEKNIKIDGLFIAIGSSPNSEIFKGQLELDSQRYIILKNEQETSQKGIFVAGDISNTIAKQAISAAGDGCTAALQAQKFLEKIGFKQIDLERKVAKVVEVVAKAKDKIFEISNEKEFEEIVIKSKIPVVVDFYATWCPPCQRMAPIFEKLAKYSSGKIKFVKIDVSQNMSLAQKIGISSIPTFIFFKGEKELKRIVGSSDFESFNKIISETFKISNSL